MIFASSPSPVFMKKLLAFPSLSIVVILDVDADDMPPAPWDETVVFEGSNARTLRTAESSFIMDIVDLRVTSTTDFLHVAHSVAQDTDFFRYPKRTKCTGVEITRSGN